MPEKATIRRARRDKRQGKAPTTQAGEFVREEIHHVREGKHGARSTKQAIAIGLSKARRAGVPLKAPGPGKAKASTRKSAKSAIRRRGKKASPTRSRAVRGALKRKGRKAASPGALGRHVLANFILNQPSVREADPCAAKNVSPAEVLARVGDETRQLAARALAARHGVPRPASSTDTGRVSF